MHVKKTQIAGKEIDIRENFLPPVLVFVIALMVRLIVTFQLNQSSPLFSNPVIDSLEYDRLARALAATGQWSHTGAFYQPPLYPLFLAGIYKIFGDSYFWPRVIQSILGSTSCMILFYIGKSFANKYVGFLAGIICALYGPLIYFELELLASVLTIFFSLLGLVFLYRGLEDQKTSQFFISGLLTGLAIISWPLTGLFTFAGVTAVFIKYKSNFKQTILFSVTIIAGTILPIIPVSSFNFIHGEPVLISKNGPITFYAANNLEWEKTVLFRVGYDWEKMTTLPYQLYSEEEVNEIGYNSIFIKESVNYIRNYPWHYLKAALTKTGHLFNGYEIMNPTDIYFFKQFSPVLNCLVFNNKYLKFPYGILLPLAIIGIFYGFKYKRRNNSLFVSYYFWGSMGLVLFCVSARFRLIVIPILALYAALGMQELIKTIYSKKRVELIFITISLIICSYCVANFDLFKQQSFFESPIVKSQSFFAIGGVMQRQKKYDEAMTWLLKAIEIDNTYSEAWNELGMARYKQGDNINAIVAFSKANKIAPDYPLPLYNLAIMYDRSRKSDLAAKEKAIYFYSEFLQKANTYYKAQNHYINKMEHAYNRLKSLKSY